MKRRVPQRILWVDEGVKCLMLSTLSEKLAEALLGPAEGTHDELFERGFQLPKECARVGHLIADAIDEGRLLPISCYSGLPLAKPEYWRSTQEAAVAVWEVAALFPNGHLKVRVRRAPAATHTPDAASPRIADPQGQAEDQAAQERADQRGAEALERYTAYRGEVTPGDLEYLIELAWAGFCAEPGPTPEAFNTLEKFKALPWDYESLEGWAKKGKNAQSHKRS